MSQFANRTPSISTSWWHSPASLVVYFVIPFFLMIAAITPWVITNAPVLDSRIVYLDMRYVLLSLALFGALAVGAFFAGKRTPRGIVRLNNGCLDFLFYTTTAAYAIWFGPLIISNPSLIIDTITGTVGAMYDVRDGAPNISGVTTATQFGISYAIIYGIKIFQDSEKLPARYHKMMLAIVVYAIFRALAFSERIALIEIVIPLFAIYVTKGKFQPSVEKFFIKPFPFILYTAAPIFFAIFEYPRSWINRYIEVYDNFPHFVMDRFSLYYVTSLNNICALLEYSPNPTFDGGWTLNWLYRMPVIGTILSGDASGDNHSWFLDFLKVYATQEYNNTTGFLTVVYDWGWVLAIILLGIYGLIAGTCFASFRSGRGYMRYFYPMFLYALFEMLRIGYIYDGRAVAGLIGIGISLVFWRRASLPVAPDQVYPSPTNKGNIVTL